MSLEDRVDIVIAVGLCSALVTGTAGMVWLAVIGREPSTALIGITSAVAGALAMRWQVRRVNGVHNGRSNAS